MATKDLTVRILGDASNFNKALAGIGNSASVTGAKLTKNLTPAAAAAGLALGSIGSSFNDSRDAIIVGTGASGAALDKLMDSSKRVAGRVPNDFGQVGVAIADVNTRLGLTGPELETVAERALNLARITGTDVATNIRSAARVTRDWGLESTEAAGVMDMMFKASQATGVGFDQLGNSVVQFGAPLRAFGFSMEESIALLSGFEAQGVNTEAVMSGLRQGLGRIARAGEEPIDVLARVSDEIKNAGTAGEANALALEVFGSRAGPDMAAAIREGRFEIDDLVATLGDSEGSIESAADSTLRFSDRMQILKNRIIGVLGPFGEIGGVAGGMVAAVGPLVFGLGQMAPLLTKLKAGFIALKAAMMAHPIMALATVAVGVGAALVMMGGNADKAAAQIDNMAEAMFAAGDAGEGLTTWLADFANDTPVFTRAMDEAGVTVAQVTEAALAGGPAWDAMKAKLDATTDAVAGNWAESAQLSTVLEGLPDAANEAADAMAQRARVEGVATEATEEATAATDELRVANTYLSANVREATEAIDANIAATQAAIDKRNQFANAAWDAQDAEDAFQDAVETMTTTLQTNDASTRQGAASVRDAARATDEMVRKQLEAEGVIIDSAAGQEIYKERLSDVATFMGGPLGDEILDHIDRLDGIQDGVVTTVTAEMQGIEATRERLEQILGRSITIPINTYNPSIGATGSFAASGGLHGGPTVVAERGFEIINLPAGSRVHTNSDSRAMLARGNAGGGTTVIYQVPVTINAGMGADGQALGRELVEILNRVAANGGAKIDPRAIRS